MLKHRVRRIESVLNRATPATGSAAVIPPRPLKTPKDLVDLLEEQIQAVRSAPWTSPLQKAQAIGVLAAIARKLMEDANTQSRIEMLELVLKQRRSERAR